MSTGVRRVTTVVPMDEAVRRVVHYASHARRDRLLKMSEFAYAVWPDAKFRNAQGAARAVSKIVNKAITQGLLEWRSEVGDWGYRWTKKDSR